MIAMADSVFPFLCQHNIAPQKFKIKLLYVKCFCGLRYGITIYLKASPITCAKPLYNHKELRIQIFQCEFGLNVRTTNPNPVLSLIVVYLVFNSLSKSDSPIRKLTLPAGLSLHKKTHVGRFISEVLLDSVPPL